MNAKPTSILIVEDERPWAEFLSEYLTGKGHSCKVALTGEEGLALFRSEPCEVALIDLCLPGIDGIEVAESIRRLRDEDTIVIMMTGYPTSETARRAFESGATDYLTKPFNANQVQLVIDRALEFRRIEEENSRLRNLIEARSCLDRIVGSSASMQAVYKLIEQVAPSDTPILIVGESGTGKTLAAHAIHRLSDRPAEAFEWIDCDDANENQIEREILGAADAPSMFERVGEGTVFLRNVDGLSKKLQSSLCQILQDHQVPRNGNGRSTPLRARILCSSSLDLRAAVEVGEIDRDLYYRLAVVTLAMPPLRERRDDIPLLTNMFLEQANRDLGRRVEKISFETMLVLCSHDWVGNVAELESTIRQLVEKSATGVIAVADLSPTLQREMSHHSQAVSAADVPLREAKRRFEREYFKDLLRRTRGNMSLASRTSRVGRPYLYKKINDYEINPNDFR